MNIDELLNYQVLSHHFFSSKFFIFFFSFKPEKPSVPAATTSTNKRTDGGTSIAPGYPKRAKRPILDDVPIPSSVPSINNTNLASLSTDERNKILQMLEQESSVRIYF
jgi:hypothetical protein